MKLCLHIHSQYSHDSDMPPKDIVDACKNEGYDIIAITDHNTVRGGMEALAYGDDTICVIPGAEFSTQYGHILAYFIDETVENNTLKADPRRFDFYSLMENIRKANGIAILAHPYISGVKGNMKILDLVDGIEIHNSRIDTFIWKKRSNSFIKALTPGDGLIYTGGADAHSLDELSHCYCHTAADGFLPSPEGLINALANKSDIYYKKSVNYNISKAKLKNLREFKPGFIMNNCFRMIFGVVELFVNNVMGRDEYEIIHTGKENQ